MSSIKVKFRPSSVEGREGAICYQVTHQRKVRLLKTEYRVLADEWDEGLAMVKTAHAADRKTYVLAIRERIRMDVERLQKIDSKLQNEGTAYTTEDIVEAFGRYSKEYSLFNFMEALVVKLKQNGKMRTSETYRATLNSFKRFRNQEDIMLDCLTTEIMERYQAWHKARGNTANTISFYTRILRAVYNRAVEEKIIDNHNPFGRVYTGVDKTVKRAVPLGRIKKMKTLELSLTPALDFARDMFLMSFYLRGMSFIDMAYLKKTDLKNGYIVYRRRKTGQQLIIKWTPQMQAILDKRPDNPTQYLVPIIKAEGVNERCAYRYAGYIINRNLKKVGTMAGIPVPLTMYAARHSWASAARAKGISLPVISEGLGHDSEATTRIYLASLDTAAIDRANSLILSCL